MQIYNLLPLALLALPTAFSQNASSILPPCAIACTEQAFAGSTCTQTNITCVCKDPTYARIFDTCENTNCSAAEQQVTNAYAVRTCAPVGGFGHNSNSSNASATSTPVPFTGSAGGRQARLEGIAVVGSLVVGLMGVVGLRL